MKHEYVSTACIHDHHDRCRLVCKFCGTPCRCPHHAGQPTPVPIPIPTFDVATFQPGGRP